MVMNILKKIRIPKINKKISIFIIVATIIVGAFLRFLAMTKGFNFDFSSYKIVGDIIKDGGNVYAETKRYNYGPIWFTILGVFREIASIFNNPDLVFRIFIVTLLTASDLAIAFILRKKYGLLAFVLFFLNPISIIITGFHNQFDNFAILIGLLGLLLLPKNDVTKIEKGHAYSAVLIGLSLMTKHIFFVLPIWLFIRCKSMKIKLFMLFTPLTIFALGFLPFWSVGHEGIVKNVFLYKSFANSPLLHSLISTSLLDSINTTVLLVAVLVLVGFMTRKLPALESGLWYLIILVTFSPAIANQYLAIVMPAVIGLGFLFFIPFILLAALLISITSREGLYLQNIINIIPDYLLPYVIQDRTKGEYNLLIFSLFVGMILVAIYRYRRNWYTKFFFKIKDELRTQFKVIKKSHPNHD